jgi:hypothetical protein
MSIVNKWERGKSEKRGLGDCLDMGTEKGGTVKDLPVHPQAAGWMVSSLKYRKQGWGVIGRRIISSLLDRRRLKYPVMSHSQE